MSYVTNQRRRFDSAADVAELAEIDRRAQKLDRLRMRIASARRALTERRRRLTDRMRKREQATAAASQRAA